MQIAPRMKNNNGTFKKMKSKIIILTLFLCNLTQAQQSNCYPNCKVDFKTVYNERNPLFSRVQISDECYKVIKEKIQEWADEDLKEWNNGRLRNVACSHSAGFVEYQPGACQAGGPPPCCPVEHWYQSSNAWEVFLSACRKIKNERANELEKIYNGCINKEQKDNINNFNPTYNLAVACLNDASKNGGEPNSINNYNAQLNKLKSDFQAAINRGASGDELKQYLTNIIELKEQICNYKNASTKVDNYNKLIKEADACMNMKDYNCARTKYQDALNNAPDNISTDTKSRLQSQVEKAKNMDTKNNKDTDNSAKKEEEKKIAETKRREAEAEKQKEEAQREQENKIFEKQKETALNSQKKYDAQTRKENLELGYLAAVWMGFYMFDKPANSYYNYKGRFFSCGPTNSFISTPTYFNKYTQTLQSNTYSKKYEEVYETTDTKINTANFGIKAELGYVCDWLHLSLPVKVNYGILPHQYNFNYTVETNVFFGFKHLKFGGGYEFGWYDMSKKEKTTNDGGNYISTYNGSSETTFMLDSYKFGFRFLNHFHSSEINTVTPFKLDLLFTLNVISERDVYRGYNSFNHPVYPGIEINLSKFGVFGFYAKAFYMCNVGNLKILANDYQVGNTKSPFFEIGIKKEYTWFKNK